MPRVFSAVDVQNADLLDELCLVRDRLDLGFSPVEPGKMHLTLEFFEEVEKAEIGQLKQAMDNVDLEGFKAEVRGVGVFPSKDYIRVIWAGVENDRLIDLYNQVSDHGVKSSNDHEFRPHITLARVKNISGKKKKKLRKTLEEFESHRFGELGIEKVKLFESRISGEGSEYSVIHETGL